MLYNITIDDYFKKIKDGILIDIRSIENYNNNHIPTSKNIPYNELISNSSKYLQFNKTYYIYCQRGITSKKACEILNKKGYHTVNIIGGYEEYILSKK